MNALLRQYFPRTKASVADRCPHCRTSERTWPATRLAFQLYLEHPSTRLGAIVDGLLERAKLRFLCGQHSDEFAADPFSDELSEEVL